MNVLDKSQQTVVERGTQYGAAKKQWDAVGRVWSELLIEAGLLPAGSVIEGWRAASMMVLLKQFRMSTGYHDDSVLDTAGYAWVIEQCKPDAAFEAARAKYANRKRTLVL